jgi:ribosome biogenesis GTPase / thiamine phosphate phosphatase
MTIADVATRLDALGWTPALAAAYAEQAAVGREPARVVAEDRGSYQVLAATGELRAGVTGRFRFEADDDPSAFPAVGDWVVVESGLGDTVIHALLPRRTALVRQAAGRRTGAQVVGANLDVVFVVASLNADLNARRLERYVAAAWESGAQPIVLLTKADLESPSEVADALSDVSRVAVGAEVIVVSSFDGRGVDEVQSRIPAGCTVAFVGSSGVGKSTLLNRLAGAEIAATSEIRDDARGRHTTTRRQLHLLPGGGLVLDTPGMRELSLWDSDGLDQTFGDIEDVAVGCRFTDCSHGAEPGCAVRAALADGRLEPDRYASWQKLRRETAHHERRVDALARAEERRKWKQIGKAVSRHMDAKYGTEGRR